MLNRQILSRISLAFTGSDFKRMGRGIEGRYHRCQGWWEPHLGYTRDFVRQHTPECRSVAVLGAGRLLDLDLGYLLKRCEVVELFDADPGVIRYWREASGSLYGKRVKGHLVDLTDSLKSWTKGYATALRRGTGADYLRGVEAPTPAWASGAYDGVISLNLLGQIPLYWRDRVLRLGCDDQGALIDSMAALQLAHLGALLRLERAWKIVITDTEYYFYHVDQSHWRVEPALFGAAQDIFKRDFANKTKQSWLWHIAPQFIECAAEGEIHRVEGVFVKAGS